MSLRRPTVALLLFTFDISPLCDVAQTSDCGTHCLLFSIISPLCGVAPMPDCGIISLYLFVHLSRRRFRHPIGNYLCSVGISGGLPLFPFYLPCYDNFECTLVNLFMTHPCMHLLYLMSKLSCEYFHSTHLAC